MKGDFLYDVVDFILNQATENELEVIQAALKRRVEGGEAKGAAGINPARMARLTAAKIKKQVGFSLDQIRQTVRGFVTEIIRKDAPELTDTQVQKLLESLMPGETEESTPAAGESPSPGAGAGGGVSAEAPPVPDQQAPAPEGGQERRPPAAGRGARLPTAALATMITQFISYSTQTMSISEQIRLNDEIQDWHKKYWEMFSPRMRQLISFYIKGEIDEGTFWQRIKAELGIESGKAQA
jgi:hypothetical protein